MKRYRLNKEARRLSRLGVEIWLPLPGHKGFYEISNLGRVRALERTIVDIYMGTRRRRVFKAMFLKLSPTDRGYVGFNANKNGVVTPCSLHRMMLLAFDGPRPDVYDGCRHLNDVKHDNVLHNLRYGTQVQNMKDCVRNGTYRHGDVSGEKNPYSKLTEAKVRAIRTAKSDTVEDVHRLAKRFGVTYSTVNNILKGRSWKHVL